jgi:hypothetical protein
VATSGFPGAFVDGRFKSSQKMTGSRALAGDKQK